MTLVSSLCYSPPLHYSAFSNSTLASNCYAFSISNLRTQIQSSVSTNVCTQKIDTTLLTIAESFYEDELWAAACLRVRSFHEFRPDTFGVQDHTRYLAEREFEALKERVSGKRTGFRRVSCINASLPLSHISTLSDDLCSSCKFSTNGEDRIVVGTLDLNQCLSLPDEIAGMKPEVVGAYITRAYLSNVCVAKELLRNGLGYALIEKSKLVAHDWGITDLYVHVAVDNEAAKKLYTKSGFVYESDEPAWQARFLDRPRRLLLWTESRDYSNFCALLLRYETRQGERGSAITGNHIILDLTRPKSTLHISSTYGPAP
ncbi:GCN5-related N-acetyltransferase 7, chloroplastic isoform X2 [Gastrolobium bilobum]|uniref:GCN5-related N-acetyltransferase 7, chloroplastic isoform X2 n=1 Tax=Gastrolobium bilobum TaxID=150636 RepID=UPI002AB08173|nr:GCN5-related N-acetyltransferase 7, chloroplastic isoform X2 [Gastrolobium bilobum]